MEVEISEGAKEALAAAWRAFLMPKKSWSLQMSLQLKDEDEGTGKGKKDSATAGDENGDGGDSGGGEEEEEDDEEEEALCPPPLGRGLSRAVSQISQITRARGFK